MIKLPTTCNRREAIRKNAKRLSDESHEELLDEIDRRDALDYEEGSLDGSEQLSNEVKGSSESDAENSTSSED